MDSLRLFKIFLFYYLSIITSLFQKLFNYFPDLNRFPSVVTLCDLALSFYFHRYGLSSFSINLDEGTRIHFWISNRRRNNKPSLVLIHGFGGNSRWQFHRQIGPLSRRFNIYMPDLVFFGKSYSTESDRSEILQARSIGEGLKRLGVERFSVFGISYGGYVAYRMAEIYRGKVEKVVILGCGICCSDDQMTEMVKMIGKDEDVVDVLVPKRPENLRFLMNQSFYRSNSWAPDFILRDFINVMCTEHRKERMEIVQRLLTRKADANPLPILNQETLIIWGDKDKIFPLFLAYQLQRHLGQKAKVEIIKDAGHAANIESPDQVNNLIESFILSVKF